MQNESMIALQRDYQMCSNQFSRLSMVAPRILAKSDGVIPSVNLPDGNNGLASEPVTFKISCLQYKFILLKINKNLKRKYK